MFHPIFTITPVIAQVLMQISSVCSEINNLSFNAEILKKIQKEAWNSSVHYSTLIEGNKLIIDEIALIIERNMVFSYLEKDQAEVIGYNEAKNWIEKLNEGHIADNDVHMIHALVSQEKPIKFIYRLAQNAVIESRSKRIVYLPPEANDVPKLMKELIDWINNNTNHIPIPIIAAITHYQFATIHPYLDGNGRTARLLTSVVLNLHGYKLNGVYCLEEYYVKNLFRYYHELSVGPSHNYYVGRADSDITSWIEYFCLGMLDSLRNALQKITKMINAEKNKLLRKLNPRQKIAITLFKESELITSNDIAQLFNITQRTARNICQDWVNVGFLEIDDEAKKSRKYKLGSYYQSVLFT